MRKNAHLSLLAAALTVTALTLGACGGSGAGSATQPAATGQVKTASIQVANGAAVGGEQTLKVKRDDHVRITVSVDAPQQIHLHGYDIEKTVQPGTPGVWDFIATFEGIFEMESHLNNPPDTLLKLEVEP